MDGTTQKLTRRRTTVAISIVLATVIGIVAYLLLNKQQVEQAQQEDPQSAQAREEEKLRERVPEQYREPVTPSAGASVMTPGRNE